MDEVLPAELPGVVHVGSGFYVALLGVVDGGGPGVGPTQNEDKAIESDSRSVFVICIRKAYNKCMKITVRLNCMKLYIEPIAT